MEDVILELYQRRSKLVFYVIWCLFFIFLAFVFMKYADAFSYECALKEFRRCCFTSPVLYVTLGKALFTYFGLSMIVFIFYIIKPYCLFSMNNEGFWTRDYGYIKWTNVSKLYLDNISCEKVICFDIKDINEVKIPFLLKIFRNVKKYFTDGTFAISFEGNDKLVDQVFKLMQSKI